MARTSGTRTCWDRGPRPLNRRVTSTTSPEDSAAMASDRQLLRRPGDRIDQPRQSLGRAGAQDSETTLLQAQDRRIGNSAETLRGHLAKDTRLQLKNVRAANDILSLCAAAGEGKLMPQLRGVAGDAVISRHQGKPTQPRIHQLRWWRSHFRPCPSRFIGLISLFPTFAQRESELYSFERVA